MKPVRYAQVCLVLFGAAHLQAGTAAGAVTNAVSAMESAANAVVAPAIDASTNAGAQPSAASSTNQLFRPPAGVTNTTAFPFTPAAALSAFRVQPGFRVELVAAEPMVQSPVAAAFDELGRLYVVEMRDYPTRRAESLGRVRLLEDTDGDGKFDKDTVFADNLPWPSAIACANGGVFVGATPDIWFLKDTDGDGVANEKRIVFTGLAADYAPSYSLYLDVQSLVNNFQWGLDNRIHGSASFNGGRLGATSGQPADLHGRDFLFDPRSSLVEAEAGGAQNGLSFDSTGHKFVSSRSDHLQAIVFDDRYTIRNPYYAMPSARVSIAADGPAPPVARLTPGPANLGAASGLTIYRGNAFPADYADNAFIGDLAGNLVHRKKILWPGIVPVAQRATSTERSEFLASSDPAFRPVQLLNGPDGALYVLDLHREVIAHPWSLPELQRRAFDLSRGSEVGRIYRIVPLDFRQPPVDQLGTFTLTNLVAALVHSNGWHRDTAARVLLERNDLRAGPLVARLLETSASAVGRLQALYTLDGLGALQLPHVLRGLADGDARVREQSLRLAEKFITGAAPASADLVAALNRLTGDPSPRVRFQLAFTLGQLPPALRPAPLAALLQRDGGDPWMQAAVLGSLAEGGDEMFARFATDASALGSLSGQRFLLQLATMIGVRNSQAEVERVFNTIMAQRNDNARLSLLRGLNDGLLKAGTSWRALERNGNLGLQRAMIATLLTEPLASEALRLHAVALAPTDDYSETALVVWPLFNLNPTAPMQSAVIQTVTRYRGAQAGADLLDHWRLFAPAPRREVLETLLARPERTGVLLSALERGFVRPADLSLVQLQRLRENRDPAIRQRAVTSIGRMVNLNRDQVLAAALPVLPLKANAARGQAVFRAQCITCHRFAGEGVPVGPDLSGAGSAGKFWLLTNILAPNRYVAPAFSIHAVTLRTGETFEGLLVSENPASVILRRPGAQDLPILRQSIQSIDNLNTSLMPEGLELGLTAQNLADLLEYLAGAL